jgi:hypothetical protein
MNKMGESVDETCLPAVLPDDVANYRDDITRTQRRLSQNIKQLDSSKKPNGKDLKLDEKRTLKDDTEVIDIIVDPQANTKM